MYQITGIMDHMSKYCRTLVSDEGKWSEMKNANNRFYLSRMANLKGQIKERKNEAKQGEDEGGDKLSSSLSPPATFWHPEEGATAIEEEDTEDTEETSSSLESSERAAQAEAASAASAALASPVRKGGGRVHENYKNETTTANISSPPPSSKWLQMSPPEPTPIPNPTSTKKI